jgi:hypothetical protein
VDYEEEIILQLYDDSLPHSPNSKRSLSLRGRDGRVHGAKKEGLGNPDALEGLADNARFECFDVDGDVGELGHLSATIAEC